MPRAYADIVGNFKGGEAAAYARGGDYDRAMRTVVGYDDQAADSYAQLGDRARARVREDETRAYGRSYADALHRDDYGAAEEAAARFGDPQGVTGARGAAAEATQQQRVEAYHELQRWDAEFAGLEAEQDETRRQQGYAALLARARQESADSPELTSVLRTWPEQWSPQVQTMVRGTIRTWRDRLLTPEQQAQNELTDRARDTAERQADIAERRASAAETTAQAALMRAGNSGGTTDQQQFTRANSLRDEYNQQTAGYRTIADFAARSETYMRRIASNPRAASGQADVGLVYALAKIYDPTSVVREGEFATVAQQGGFGEQVRSYVNSALGNGLSPAIRNQIMTEIRNGVRAAQGQRDQIRTRYTTLAERSGIEPSMVIDDYAVGSPGAPSQLPPPAQRVVGQVYTMPDGVGAIWDGNGFVVPDPKDDKGS